MSRIEDGGAVEAGPQMGEWQDISTAYKEVPLADLWMSHGHSPPGVKWDPERGWANEGRDIWEVSNQLAGYVDERTPQDLCDFLIRESKAAADLAAEITRLRAENAGMREALEEAETFIDGLRQDLFSRRVADWYPEGAHNAAEAMSEDMRLLGNACAGFDARAALSKASQAEGQTP